LAIAFGTISKVAGLVLLEQKPKPAPETRPEPAEERRTTFPMNADAGPD
jgi:hypothetical protein